MTRDLWKTADGKFDAGAASVETWIPDGGFEIQRRKVKGSDGNPIIADCLVPKWPEYSRRAPATRSRASIGFWRNVSPAEF